MKPILIFIFIFAISTTANSQIRRGISPYRFIPDMYIGANIGPNAFLGEGFSEYGFNGSIGVSESVFIGYNFMETFGARVIGSFSNMNWPKVSNSTVTKFSTMSMSLEMLLNVSNFFDIYNLNRPFDFSLFAGTGFITREKSSFQNEYFGLLYKGGIKADYRINYNFEINGSISGHIVSQKFSESIDGLKIDAFPELLIGVTYHIRGGSNYR